MEINRLVNNIRSEGQGFFLIEINDFQQIESIIDEVKGDFYEKQYEIDTSFLDLRPEPTAKFISIGQVRDLKKEFLHTNVLNLNRVIVIQEINLLNNNSINGLLKLIEEVPQKTFFIFFTSNLLQIPKTILSRARILRLNNNSVSLNLEELSKDMVLQNQNISDELIKGLINPFIALKKIDFFDNVKLFSKDQINTLSLIFLKILNYYLKKSLNNKKLYKYLYELHSSYLYDINESIQFNTLTNDLIAIYFTRLNSNLINYAK